jgi:hypothetical protein
MTCVSAATIHSLHAAQYLFGINSFAQRKNLVWCLYTARDYLIEQLVRSRTEAQVLTQLGNRRVQVLKPNTIRPAGTCQYPP